MQAHTQAQLGFGCCNQSVITVTGTRQVGNSVFN